VISSRSAVVTLPEDKQILITREFDAPKELVYKAWTTPELVMRWWSGRRGAMRIAEIDLRVGGAWRYVMDAEAGHEVAFHGEFREIVPNERLVNTEIYEGAPGSPPAIVTTTFTEVDGRAARAARAVAPLSRRLRRGGAPPGGRTPGCRARPRGP